ncbi:glycosyltransferase family 2 protein [Kocuria sp. CH-021]|uniref:glycosyltransferase family 2 protein n=1 Tax=Kocuria sp. CH-021 TaxID=3406735 RepID=UPI003C75CF85
MTEFAGTVGMVVVAVLTYRRQRDLEALLPLLVDQVSRACYPSQVLVVDNDPDGQARATVTAVDGPVRYIHEPEPGIAAARNRALDESRGARAVVFIDDDERPGPDWLDTLVSHWRRSGATAVVGPVVSSFDMPLPIWVASGDFFRRRRLPTGTRVDVAATNNLLLDLNWVDRQGLRFDVAFGLSGGEDTLFTRQLARLGGTMEWNDQALVTDVVPVARSTRGWVLQRALSSGNTWSRVSLELAESGGERLRHRVVLVGRGTLRLVVGTARAGWGTAVGRMDHQAKGARTVARGLGLVLGACGYVHSEYKRLTPGQRMTCREFRSSMRPRRYRP